MDKDKKIIFYKNYIDNDKFNEYYELIKKYIDSKYYDEKYDKYFVEFLNTYNRKLEAGEEIDTNIKQLRNYIVHKSHYDEAIKVFTNNFKYYLTKNNKTVADLSKDLHIAYSTINDWYNGKKYPRVDSIHILADYFNIRFKDLAEEHKKEEKKGAVVPVLGNIPARYTYWGYWGYNGLWGDTSCMVKWR